MPDARSHMNMAMCAAESLRGHYRPRFPKGFGVCASWPDLIEEKHKGHYFTLDGLPQPMPVREEEAPTEWERRVNTISRRLI
jgi:hypothetical protein